MSELAERQDVEEAIRNALHPAPATLGFAPRGRERTRPVNMPPWFIDRCRQAYLAVRLDELRSSSEMGNRVIGVSSPVHGEGKTSIAVGIATALAADTSEPTILVECDFASRVGFNDMFGLDVGPGLCEWLDGRQHLRLIQAAPLENAFVLPAGDPGADPARLVFRLTESDLIERLKPSFRNIVIDLPPMINIAYSSLACRLADRILLVARYGVTMMEDLEKAMFLLGQERVAGVVMNSYQPHTPAWLRRLL
jgi:Mrp family chromosome partitioning ATPase